MIDARYETQIELPGVGILQVRCLTPADGGVLYQFFEALSERSRGWFRPHRPWDRATAAQVAASAESPDEVRFLALASVHGRERPIGYGFFTRLETDRPVLGIAIADEFQGKGVGQALMCHLMDTARRLGKPSVRLTVDEDNFRARHVYEKAGFKTVRVIHEMEATVERAVDTRYQGGVSYGVSELWRH